MMICVRYLFHAIIFLLFVPQSRSTLADTESALPEQIKFYQYLNMYDYQELCHDSLVNHLKMARLHKKQTTYFIIDGFLSHIFSNMTQSVKNVLLKHRPDANIIVLDWSAFSGYNDLDLADALSLKDAMSVYSVAKTKVQFVGKKLARYISTLITANMIDIERIHIIGYSLGAHIAGVAGHLIIKQEGVRIPRISGLDPAGPGFSMKRELMDKRLDKDDAEFVDIFYTNRYGVGEMGRGVGHADIYVNGGSEQPGCESKDLLISTICNHQFSWRLWNYCVLEECVACRCTSPMCSQDGSRGCPEKVQVVVGMNASMDLVGEFYLEIDSIPEIHY